MKKYRFLVSLLLLTGLAASCSKDGLDESPNAENNRVVLTVNADDVLLQSGPQTRSASGDLQLTGYALRYILEVFTNSGSVLSSNRGNSLYREERLVADASQPENFEFDIEDAGDYCAVLWADYVADGATLTDGHYADEFYTTTGIQGALGYPGYPGDPDLGLRYIQINSFDYAVNTPALDAFYATKIFTKTATAPLNLGSITLKRPLARINIIEKDADMLAKLNKMDLLYDVPLTFHPVTGETSGTQHAAVNNITTFPNATAEKANLFYDYIFAPASGATGLQALGEIKITYDLQDKPNKVSTIPSGIPIEQNKRTNVSGKIITDNSVTKLSMELDDEWGTPDKEKDIDN